MEEKKFQNKKFKEEQHKGTEKGAKVVKGVTIVGGIVGGIGLALKKSGAKSLKEGLKIASKIIFRS